MFLVNTFPINITLLTFLDRSSEDTGLTKNVVILRVRIHAVMNL